MSTPWSSLPETFLSEGTWSVGQHGNAPDRQLFRELLRAVDDGSRARTLLEVGFGSCIDFAELNAANLILPSPHSRILYDGYDATPELVAAAQAAWPGTNFFLRDVLEMDDENAFDVVYARHVLEHVADGEEALRRLWRATRGIVVLSFFIHPTFTPSDVGCVIGDGFEHHTYFAPRWIELAASLGAHLHRIDFDHHLTQASVWLLCRTPQPELVAVADQFAQSPEFLGSLEPVPGRVNEENEASLDVLDDAFTAMGAVIPILDTVPDLHQVVQDEKAALRRAETHLEPTQDEPGVGEVIGAVRDAIGRADALGEDDPLRPELVQDLRDAHRVIETRLIEARRLADPPA